MQQEIDAGRHAENAADQEHGAGSCQSIERQSAATLSDLDRDAADDHHLDGVDRVFHEVKKQGAA